jgi:hypothetical protein
MNGRREYAAAPVLAGPRFPVPAGFHRFPEPVPVPLDPVEVPMPGPLPKPNAVRRPSGSADFVVLPAEGRQGPPPPLPAVRAWAPATLDAWARLWASPQATRWGDDGASLVGWAIVFDRLVSDDGPPAPLLAQLRATEAEFGLTPAGMAKLRWTIAGASAGADGVPVRSAGGQSARDRLRAAAGAPMPDPVGAARVLPGSSGGRTPEKNGDA